MKAAYKKFEEERIPELKKEFPTLKLSQLKEKLWREVILLVCLCIFIVEKESIESNESIGDRMNRL